MKLNAGEHGIGVKTWALESVGCRVPSTTLTGCVWPSGQCLIYLTFSYLSLNNAQSSYDPYYHPEFLYSDNS